MLSTRIGQIGRFTNEALNCAIRIQSTQDEIKWQRWPFAGVQHVHWRHVRLYHHDADGAPRRLLQRRRRLPHLFVSALPLSRWQGSRQRIRWSIRRYSVYPCRLEEEEKGWMTVITFEVGIFRLIQYNRCDQSYKDRFRIAYLISKHSLHCIKINF